MKQLFLIFNLLWALLAQGQSNVVLNCDFQDGNPPGSSGLLVGCNDYQDDLDSLNWQTCAQLLNVSSGNTCTTSDYFKGDMVGQDRLLSGAPVSNELIRFPLDTKDNDQFIGMLSSGGWDEGIILPISHDLKSMGDWVYYRLTLDVAISDTGSFGTVGNPVNDPSVIDHYFEISLSEFTENWNSNSSNNIFIEDIAPDFILPANAPLGWNTISTYFSIPRSVSAPGDINNLVIKTNRDKTGRNSFYFIDNVILEEFNACTSVCANDSVNADIRVLNLVPDDPNNVNSYGILNLSDSTIFATNYSNGTSQDLKILFTNTMYYKVSIYDGYGGKQYEYEALDINIIEDPDSITPFSVDSGVFRWWGIDQSGNALLGPGAINDDYLLTIEARNCFSTENIGTSIDFIHPSTVYDYIDLKDEHIIDTLQNCCPDHLIVDGFDYVENTRENRNNYIHSGLNSDVRVLSGNRVQYNAGNEVVLGSNFSVLPGGEFEAFIRDCESNNAYSWKKSPSSEALSFPYNSNEKISNLINRKQARPVIYPNPTNGTITISKISSESEVRVTDVFGKTIQLEIIPPGTSTMDLSHYRKGMYFIKIENYETKVVVY